MKKPIYYVLIGVLLLVFGFSAFMVVNYFVQGKQQAQEFDQLSQLASNAAMETTVPPSHPTTAPTSEGTEATEPAGPTEPTMIPGYAPVYEQNNDMAGWIRIEGTKIDYPVMFTPEQPDKYLKMSFYNEYSDWGCIFADGKASLTEPSDNITLYGHCMRDGSMFASLHEYMDPEFWKTHQLIYFDTLYEYHVYEIFAVFKTSANQDEGFKYHMFANAENEAEFLEFVNTCKELSFYDTGITPVYGDKLICLSTCEYDMYENGRLVVAARRIF